VPHKLLTEYPEQKFYTFETINLHIMIQRVQSVYLLLVTILMSFLLIRPYAELTLTDGQVLTFRTHVIENNAGSEASSTYKATIPVVMLVLIAGLLSFANIFFFSRRIMQLRICIVNTGLLLILLVIMFIYYSSAKHSLDVSHHAFRISAIFPMMSIFLNLMAYRNIQSDEMLVKSYNRIR
jgi:hypothetical protein